MNQEQDVFNIKVKNIEVFYENGVSKIFNDITVIEVLNQVGIEDIKSITICPYVVINHININAIIK